MSSYCLKCRVSSTSNSKKILLSKCIVCNSKKWRLIKEQETKGILSSLRLKIPLSKFPLFGDILFQNYKMNEKSIHFY